MLQQLYDDRMPLSRLIVNLSIQLAVMTSVGVGAPALANFAPSVPPDKPSGRPNPPPPFPSPPPNRPAGPPPPDSRFAPPRLEPLGAPPQPLVWPQNLLPDSSFQDHLLPNHFSPLTGLWDTPSADPIGNVSTFSKATTWQLLKTFSFQPWPRPTIGAIPTISASPSPPAQAQPLLAETPTADPELGEIRLKPNRDPELGTLTLRPIGSADPELGDLRIREPRPLPAPPPPKAPSVFLLGRVDYFRNTNIFSSAFLSEADGLIRSGFTLFYAPALGPQTYAVTSIDANIIRYANASLLNYDELRFRAGILQRLSPRMFGEIGWSNQQLFTAKEGLRTVLSGERFLNDNSLRIEFSRQDPLSPRLSFNTYYQFRWSLVDEIKDYDRLVNTLVGSLSYQLTPSLQAALDYQFIWTHFTQQPREDWYHQLAGRLSYTLNPRTQINIFGGRSFGNSSNPGLDFNGWLLGVGIVFNVPLF